MPCRQSCSPLGDNVRTALDYALHRAIIFCYISSNSYPSLSALVLLVASYLNLSFDKKLNMTGTMKSYKYRILTETLKLVCMLLFLTLSANAENTVIKAGHVFDARSGKMLDNQIIIIQDGKIKEVGTNLKFSQTDKIIDLSNSWVLPGLMDCHVHITDNESYRSFAQEQVYATESTALRALRGSVVAKQFLDNGFTTIKEIGNDANYATADIIKAIQRGWIQGPTIIYAGKIIAPFGGQSRNVNFEHEHFWNFEYIDADTPDEIKKAVRQNIYYGATVIKMVTGDNGIYDAEDIKAAVHVINTVE